MVALNILGKLYNMRLHRLVVMKYLPNPMCYEQVTHKDGDKSNNHVSNLEWCSGELNIRHGLLKGLIASGENSPNAVLSDAEVSLIRLRVLRGESYKVVWNDYKDRMRWWGFRDICRGKVRVKRV